MMKIIFVVLSLSCGSGLFSQPDKLPVTLLTAADTSKPFIFYLSGDGGWNNFSSSLAETINKNGYTIAGLNSKSYFWEEKTPEQAANDLAVFINNYMAGRKNQQWVITGYSFGADVIPFIVNFLPPDIKQKMIGIILLAPSASTDFEIHWADIIGWNKKRKMDVPSEINKLGILKTVILFADHENDFPLKNITLKNYYYESIPGGHHFEGNTSEVAKTMMKYFK